jgi:hypothetical protein
VIYISYLNLERCLPISKLFFTMSLFNWPITKKNFETLEIPQYVTMVQIENHGYILVLGNYLNFQRIITFFLQ